MPENPFHYYLKFQDLREEQNFKDLKKVYKHHFAVYKKFNDKVDVAHDSNQLADMPLNELLYIEDQLAIHGAALADMFPAYYDSSLYHLHPEQWLTNRPAYIDPEYFRRYDANLLSQRGHPILMEGEQRLIDHLHERESASQTQGRTPAPVSLEPPNQTPYQSPYPPPPTQAQSSTPASVVHPPADRTPFSGPALLTSSLPASNQPRGTMPLGTFEDAVRHRHRLNQSGPQGTRQAR